MRLVSFTVRNFRSITAANRIDVSDTTVLVGPNNEGKSNVLRALVTAMHVLTKGVRPSPFEALKNNKFWVPRFVYEWNKDFPIHLQKTCPDGASVFGLDFELTDKEVTSFRKSIQSDLDGRLPLQLEIGRDSVKVSVRKKGPGGRVLSQKAGAIAKFVANRIEFEYIPAIRTAKSAQRVVDSMVERELSAVEALQDYKDAVKKIEELQQPVLDALSKSIKTTMVSFLPAIKDVKFSITHEERAHALRKSSRMIVNDGTPTELEYKGDGVQSLAAIALMRHSSESSARGKNFVVAIEEPESHLHPSAMHVLKSVLSELARKHQVVITTHSPLFVDRAKITSNILVNEAKARPAKSVEEIRSILGVRAADNLKHAELVLLVEGEDDRLALSELLRVNSSEIAAALDNNALAIDTLNGGSNLPYKAGLIRDSLCSCHCFVDNDDAGKKGVAKARQQGLLDVGDVNLAAGPGLVESELEDLYDTALYKDTILNVYKVSLDSAKFKTNNKKWSDRMHDVFVTSGKPWDDATKAELKLRVAQIAAANATTALHPAKRGAFDGLVASLETRIRQLNTIR